MLLGGEIDDELGAHQIAGAMHEHPAGLHLVMLARQPVFFVVLGESLFELERDALAHDANTIDGVHQSVRLGFEQISCRVSNHIVSDRN
jgi:hypothetical protein